MSIDAFLDAFIPNAEDFEQEFTPDTVESYAKILKESCDDANLKKEAKGGSSGYADHLVARGWVSASIRRADRRTAPLTITSSNSLSSEQWLNLSLCCAPATRWRSAA